MARSDFIRIRRSSSCSALSPGGLFLRLPWKACLPSVARCLLLTATTVDAATTTNYGHNNNTSNSGCIRMARTLQCQHSLRKTNPNEQAREKKKQRILVCMYVCMYEWLLVRTTGFLLGKGDPHRNAKNRKRACLYALIC